MVVVDAGGSSNTTEKQTSKVEYYGKVLIDLTNDSVSADKMLDGITAHDKSGQIVTGNIPNNGAISKEFDGIYTKSATIPAGYTTGGTVQLGNNIDQEVSDQADLIAQCMEALEGKVAAGPADPVLQEKTVSPATSAQSVVADDGYDGLSKVTVNAMPTATQATPSISVSSAGKITASSTQTAGYVAAGTKSATKQLTTQAAKTITPTTSNQTAVASGRYTTGAVTVKGDSNLIAANIVSGKSIFGVAGSATTGEDVTAETNAYTTNLAALETQLNALNSELDGKAAGSGGGASIETCAVTLKHYPSYSLDYLFTSIIYSTIDSNGNVVTINKNSGLESDTIVLENVVCNTPIYTKYNGMFVYQGDIAVYDSGVGFRVFSVATDITIESQPTG